MSGMVLSVLCDIYLFIKYTYFHAILLICVPTHFYHNVCRALGGGISSTFAGNNLSGNGLFILSRV